MLSSQNGKGSYTVTQADTGSALPPSAHLEALGVSAENRLGLNFSIGPITVRAISSSSDTAMTDYEQITGYLDTSNFGLGVEAKLFGISLGTFYGNLKEGLGITIDVLAAKGSLNFYLKDSALWVKVSLDPIWGSGINIDQKIFDI